jgi:glucose/arabinose dehydrogenase/PKD repeat protein
LREAVVKDMTDPDKGWGMRCIVSLLASILLAVGALLVGVKPAAAPILPSGFEDQKVASVSAPTALASMPDGRLLITNQIGKLRVYQNGALLSTSALDISSKVCSNSERGLLGVAVDPNFSTNKYVYLFYTYKKVGSCPTFDPTNPSNPVNRVSRFVMSGNTADPNSEKVLIDNIPSIGRHNAGDLHFGKDGYLYISVGDAGCDYANDSGCQEQNDASRDTHVLLGKILRITGDGGIPASNPYTGSNSARCNITAKTDPGKNCQETFAMGLRNPFKIALDPDASGTRLFIGDVGQDAWDEVDQAEAGADYGWSLCEGNHDNPAQSGSVNCSAPPYTPPTHEYSHAATGCASITGGAFVPNGVWPAKYDDSYLFGDYVCNKIFELKPASGGGFTMSEFATGLQVGGPVDLAFGAYGTGQALYYSTYNNGSGEVHRIAYTSPINTPPTAEVTASPTYGGVPLQVSFDASESSDPDSGDTLTYLWDFGDGSTDTGSTTTHTYETAGTYFAKLTVRDNGGAEDSETVRIDAGNTSPEPTIESPAEGTPFKVGREITLQGSATDAEDGQLADTSLQWDVLQHHNCDHTHPLLSSESGNNLTLTAPPPENLHATDPACNYLEIRLTATDSKGLMKTVTRDVRPSTADLTFASQPTGAQLEIDGEAYTAPQTIVSWEDYSVSVNAPSPQTLEGTLYAFSSWSDGGTQSHNILTGTESSTYTATYNAAGCTITGTSAGESLTGTSGDDVICGGGGNDTIMGLGGNDILKGDDGSDSLVGGAGDDNLDGGLSRTDKASYSSSLTAVSASLTTNSATGEGSDTFSGIENLLGSPKNDTLTGSAAINTLTGSGGADKLSGFEGADNIIGSAGNDIEHGNSGNDAVVGSEGADTLYGEDGDDAINSQDGVNGNDSLYGGPQVNGDTKITDATEKSIVGFP